MDFQTHKPFSFGSHKAIESFAAYPIKIKSEWKLSIVNLYDAVIFDIDQMHCLKYVIL